MDFKSGDRVRTKYFDRYAYGEVTIVKGDTCKVIWDGDVELDYWYYSKKELELVDTDEDK